MQQAEATRFEERCCNSRSSRACGNRFYCFLSTIRKTRVVTAKLSTIYGVSALWQRPGVHATSIMRGAHRFLFRPRPWVTAISDCVMGAAALSPGRFFSVHIRRSPQKVQEARASRKVLPSTLAFDAVARLAGNATGLRRCFVQVSSPKALAEFKRLIHGDLELSYTEHPRQEDDSWGGWSGNTSSTSLQTVVAAVNAHIASQASIVLSPAMSLWTPFLANLMGLGPPPLWASYSCAGTRVSGYINVVISRAERSHSERAPQQRLQSERWKMRAAILDACRE